MKGKVIKTVSTNAFFSFILMFYKVYIVISQVQQLSIPLLVFNVELDTNIRALHIAFVNVTQLQNNYKHIHILTKH